MQSILKSDRIYLFIDASSPTVQVGLWRNDAWLSFAHSEAKALESIHSGVATCLQQAELKLDAIEGFIHCEGPGSVLGIRLAGIAINAWRALPDWKDTPIYTYRSLPLVAHSIAETKSTVPPFYIISEGRQKSWNVYHSTKQTLEQVEPETLETLTPPLFHFQQRKTWHTPPQDAQPIILNLEANPQLLNNAELLSQSETPTLYEANQPSYKKWDNQRHR